MKHKLLFTLGLIVAWGWAVFAAVPAQAATSAGPYYAPPAWDQQLQCDTPATCPRFIVLSNWNNEAVLDRETGLVWEQSPSTGTFTWQGAQLHCNQLTVGNRKGWRLPTLQELASLIDPTQFNPVLPNGHPFTNVQSSFYWSATTFADVTPAAWIVRFLVGGVDAFGKSSYAFVWCVRGGQGVDPQ